tara:strand:+ start:805 stop:1512 length:708 start_codon:yes stop_codon:yes gene_type:complete
MFIGMGMPIPDLANLPGVSRPGGGGGGDAGLADIDNLYSMDFDGVDDHIVTNLNLAYTVYPNITASFWIKIDPSDITATNIYYPIGVEAGVYVNGSLGRLYAESASSVKVLIQGQGGNTFSTTNLADNNWHNIIITYEYDAAGTIANVYVDGSQEITNKLLLSFAPLTGTLSLGSRNGSISFYVGKLDEVAVWNSILDTSDIEAIYNATSAGSPAQTADLSAMATPPLAWYRMGD